MTTNVVVANPVEGRKLTLRDWTSLPDRALLSARVVAESAADPALRYDPAGLRVVGGGASCPAPRRPDMITAKTSPSKKVPATKSAMVRKLLARPRGATMPELTIATGWQNHSVRAFFTGLRKKGLSLAREERTSGELAYRLVQETPIEQAAA